MIETDRLAADRQEREGRERARRGRRIGWILAIAFVAALLMGPGPGMRLANRPVAVGGFPALYVWGLVWYVVEVSIVVLAYLFVWSHDDEASSG